VANFSRRKTSGVIFEELLLLPDPDPHGGAYNMAMDEVLLRGAVQPLLRVYRWASPAVSFGYFGCFAEVRPLWPERELVRRWTGGGIVPHGEDFTYTLIVPKRDSFAARPAAESYRMIHEAVAQALGDVDGALSLAGGLPKVSDECFANPTAHDILAGGIKIAGAAQRRTRHGLLHQGSIQRSGLGGDFAARLAGALAPRVGARGMSAGEENEAAKLAEEKYGTAEWLRRF
jgi:lipoate-protein ligase A